MAVVSTMFIHDLAIERVEYDEDVVDDAGQPTAGASTTSSVRGLVQPRGSVRASETEDYRSAGSEIGDHVIFMPADTDIRNSDAVLFDDGRYNVVGVRRFRYGTIAHLEVDANLVTPTPTVGTGS